MTADDNGADDCDNVPISRGHRFGPSGNPEKYEVDQEIGAGAAAVVFKGHVVESGRPIAIKVINLVRLRLKHDFKREKEKLRREVQILRSLKHPRIVCLEDVVETDTTCFLVMELLEGGEIFYPIVKKGKLNEEEARNVLVQVAEALHFLHLNHVVHRDLKPENILISNVTQTSDGEMFEVKLVDFGLSKLIQDGYSTARTFVGTPQYWAPEVIDAGENGTAYDYRVDLWSLGIFAYVMLGGTYPFEAPGQGAELGQKIKSGKIRFRGAKWEKVSADAKDAISGLLNVDKTKRLSIGELMEHPFLKDYPPAQRLLATVRGKELGLPTPWNDDVPLPIQDGAAEVPRATAYPPETSKPTAAQVLPPQYIPTMGATPPQRQGSRQAWQEQDPGQLIVAPAGTRAEEIFGLAEMLELQGSIAKALETGFLAFRGDLVLREKIRALAHKARLAQEETKKAVGFYSGTAQQVRELFADLKLAVEENEPECAVELLSLSKEWVEQMKNKGSTVRERYEELTTEFASVLKDAHIYKDNFDTNLAENTPLAGRDAHSVAEFVTGLFSTLQNVRIDGNVDASDTAGAASGAVSAAEKDVDVLDLVFLTPGMVKKRPTRESAHDVFEIVGEFDRLASQQRSRASTQCADTLDPVVQQTSPFLRAAPMPTGQSHPQIENGKLSSPTSSRDNETQGSGSPLSGPESRPQKEPSIDQSKAGEAGKRAPSYEEVAADGTTVNGTVTDLALPPPHHDADALFVMQTSALLRGVHELRG
jgi:serine/threonine protein kinase